MSVIAMIVLKAVLGLSFEFRDVSIAPESDYKTDKKLEVIEELVEHNIKALTKSGDDDVKVVTSKSLGVDDPPYLVAVVPISATDCYVLMKHYNQVIGFTSTTAGYLTTTKAGEKLAVCTVPTSLKANNYILIVEGMDDSRDNWSPIPIKGMQFKYRRGDTVVRKVKQEE